MLSFFYFDFIRAAVEQISWIPGAEHCSSRQVGVTNARDVSTGKSYLDKVSYLRLSYYEIKISRDLELVCFSATSSRSGGTLGAEAALEDELCDAPGPPVAVREVGWVLNWVLRVGGANLTSARSYISTTFRLLSVLALQKLKRAPESWPASHKRMLSITFQDRRGIFPRYLSEYPKQ